MEIKRNGSRPSGKGPADWSTEASGIDLLLDTTELGKASPEPPSLLNPAHGPPGIPIRWVSR